ncbi:MAG: L,D-transpeptidase [Ktedonobacteraceae bacterium]
MNYQGLLKRRSSRQRPYIFLLSAFVLCAVLLNACSSASTPGASTTASGAPTSLPTPSISPTLKSQGEMQLQTFQQWIALMQQYGSDATPYQQQYTGDQQALTSAQTSSAYQSALITLNTHVDGIKIPATKAEAQGLQQQLQQKATDWGKQHTYHDTSNNTTYPLGYEYGSGGIGGWVQGELSSAQTIADYQWSIDELYKSLTNFQAMTDNFGDKTPYNQPHKTDLQLLQHYGDMDRRVVVVSLEEQAMRVYDHGKLVKAFLVTTGRPDKPSLPGAWWVEGKKSPTVFKAGVPKSSPYYYPDTPIHYAMQYHSNGYFLHDSWWRVTYGPGTNYPHQDASGDPFSSQGSHGCVNISLANAAWLYNFVVVYTPVLMY